MSDKGHMFVIELEDCWTHSHGGNSKCHLIWKHIQITLNTGVAINHAALCRTNGPTVEKLQYCYIQMLCKASWKSKIQFSWNCNLFLPPLCHMYCEDFFKIRCFHFFSFFFYLQKHNAYDKWVKRDHPSVQKVLVHLSFPLFSRVLSLPVVITRASTRLCLAFHKTPAGPNDFHYQMVEFNLSCTTVRDE